VIFSLWHILNDLRQVSICILFYFNNLVLSQVFHSGMWIVLYT